MTISSDENLVVYMEKLWDRISRFGGYGVTNGWK